MKKFYVLNLCALLSIASCVPKKSDNSTSDTKWFTGGAIFKSHEDLVSLSVKMANEKIGWALFPEVKEGDAGSTSTNQVVLGNYHTDFPNDRIRNYYAENGYDVDVKTNKALHFVRSFVNDQPVSMQQACVDSKKKILQVTNLALASWNVKDASSFFFWAGHASHIIQDSFSPAHVKRGGDDLRIIKDICTSVKEVTGICYHGFMDAGDTVWDPKSGGTYDPSIRPLWAMKKEAQTAVMATSGYFYMLSQATTAKIVDGTAMLNEYFISSDVYNGGYLDCDKK